MTFDATRRWVAVTMFAVVAAMSLSVGAQQGPQGPGALFERARLLEENSKTLNEAILLYKQVASQAGSNRALAAQALLRAAECYQKLGDVQARGLYEQLVSDYADQKDVVTQARTRLGGTAAVASAKGDRAVWTGPNVDRTGRVSADGRFITFVDWNNGRLMIHDVATNTDRALTAAAPNYSQQAEGSAISKDGKQVAYVWLAEKGVEFRVAALQGSGFVQPRRLNADYFSTFDWSPDGKWIAAGIKRADGSGEIGLVSVADGSFRRLISMDLLVFHPESKGSIFFSPDGRYIAYDRPATDASLQRDVFVLAIDDSREIPAVVHGAHDALMGWSPDESRLLFSSDRTGTVGLWAQPFGNGKPQGSPELLKSDIGPSSSLGVTTSGALYVAKGVSSRDIAIAPIDLEAGRLLGPPVNFPQGFMDGAEDPDWSPDGKFLAYAVANNNGRIAIRSVATGQVRRLAPTMIDVNGLRWSPDGRSLLTRGRDVRMKGREGIFSIDVQSGEATAVILSEEIIGLVQWSSDGKKVLYYSLPGVLVERDLASGTERVVYQRVVGRYHNLSPDGQYIPLIRTDAPTKTTTLALVPVAGGQPREVIRLTQPEALAGPAVWIPNGSGVLITKVSGSRRELWLVPVTGGQPRRLDIDPNIWMEGGTGGSNRGFSLSPDGRSIAFQTGKAAAEVWALENFLPAAPARR